MPDRPATPALTIELLRSLAVAQGLALTDDELVALLPLVKNSRDPHAAAPDMPPDTEPAVQLRLP